MVCSTAIANQNASRYFFSKSVNLFIVFILLAAYTRAQPCNSPIQNNSFVIVPAVCNGTVALLQGSVPTGGNGSYTYQWESTSSSNCADNSFTPISGATQKDYSVPSTANQQLCYRRVVSSGTCSSVSNKTKVQGADLTTPSPPTVTITNPNCAGGGTITVTQPAPAPGISYSINGTDYSNTSGIFSSLIAGNYSVTAKLLSGCISPARAVNLAAAAALTGIITPASASICAGQSQVLTVSGGTSYQWYRNNTVITGATSNTYTATQAGTYRADIINGSCMGASSNSSVITILPAPVGTISPASANLCAGDSVALSASGGSSYQWYRDNVIINGAVSATYRAKQGGTYSVDIIGSNGCKAQATNTALITMTSAPAGTIAPAAVTICTGGSATLTSNGGTSYQWYKDNVIIAGATAATYIATQPGTYKTEITNAAGCKAFSSNNAVVSVGASPSGSITPASGQLCGNNASLTLTVGGGTSYQWYRNGVAISGATAATYIVTTTGTYTAQITSGSCTGMATNSVVISQGTAPGGSISPASSTICPGESQLLSVSGGTSYQWMRNGVDIAGANSSTYLASQPGTYTVTIINGTCSGAASNAATVTAGTAPSGTISPANATICTGSSQLLTASGGASYQWFKDNVLIPGATATTYTATQPGTYKTEITNASGCKAFSSNNAVVTITATPTGAISPATGTLCTNGSLVLTVTGGTTYQWYRNGILISGATASTYTVTQPGTYTADIINSGGCKASATNAATITQGAAPSGSITPASATICAAQNVTLTAGGGTSYQWFLNGNAIPGATASTYSVALPGTYSVTIFSGSCSGPASNTAVVSASTPITFSINTVQPTCGQPQGTITINSATGGSGGYLYSINNGSTFQSANTFTNLPAGTYSLMVKDVSDCRSAVQTVIINPPSSTLLASITTTNITCTQPTGTVTVSTNGGTMPYQYSLDGGPAQSANSFTNVTAGSHKVVIIDAGGCTLELAFTIQTINSTLGATVTTTNPLCGQQTGAVQITAKGGTPGYTYSLDNGAYQAANSFTNVAPGTHLIKVKDQAGCITQVNFQIDQTGTPPTLIITAPPPICVGGTANLQSASITAGSDTALTFTYWNDTTATSPVANPAAVPVGKYFIKATNRGGCITIKPVTVSSSTTIGSISVSGSTTPCRGQVVTLTASNGISYQWYLNNNPITGAVANTYPVTADGTYSVLIDNGNCRAFASNQIQIQYKDCPTLTDPKVFVPTAFSPNNNNANDVLRPILHGILELRYFRVYNRWGQLVFQTNTIGKGWDGMLNGKPQPSEPFSWMLECIDINGNTIKQSGRSILIR